MIDRVRAGESILITDRGVPVARLEPTSPVDWDARLARLERKGVIRRGRGSTLDVLHHPPVETLDGSSVVELLLEDRRSGR